MNEQLRQAYMQLRQEIFSSRLPYKYPVFKQDIILQECLF